jgi:DNA polymerase III subunit epsilon
MRQVFLDTETTGLSAAQGDRIIEIGCIEYVNRRKSGRQLHHYINPDRSSHPDAVRVHGITDQFLADKPRFVQGAEVIIHNAAFDCGFLDAEFARVGLAPIGKTAGRITDTLMLARQQYPGKANSLDALCKRLEVDNSGRELHGALLDAGLLAEVYLRMTRGQGSLVIDATATRSSGAQLTKATDLSAFDLPVLYATEAECQAHAAVLVDLGKASNGKTVWPLQPD